MHVLHPAQSSNAVSVELTRESAWHIRYGMFGSIANDATITLLLMVFMLAGRDPRTVEDVKRMHDQPRTMTLVEEIDTMMSYCQSMLGCAFFVARPECRRVAVLCY
jgi:hypothetical protein